MQRIFIFLLVFICSSIEQRVVISIQATKEFPFSFTCPNGQVLFSDQYFSAETFLVFDVNTPEGFVDCANSFSDNIDASFNLTQTATRITETIIYPYKESAIFHSILNSTDFSNYKLSAIVVYGRDLDSKDQIQIDIAFIGNSCRDSVRDSDLGEECDSTTGCDNYCGCMTGYQVDQTNLSNTYCAVPPNLGLLWLLMPFVAIVVGLTVVLSVLKRKGKLRCCNERDHEPDEEVEMSKLQPIEPHNYPPQPYYNNQSLPPQIIPPQPLPYPPLRSVLPPSNFGSAPVIPYPPNQPPMPILPPPGHNPYGPSPYMDAPNPMPLPQMNYGQPPPPPF